MHLDVAIQGVSVVVVLAESHLSIHTWPELGYAALDLFTCDRRGAEPVWIHMLRMHNEYHRHHYYESNTVTPNTSNTTIGVSMIIAIVTIRLVSLPCH